MRLLPQILGSYLGEWSINLIHTSSLAVLRLSDTLPVCTYMETVQIDRRANIPFSGLQALDVWTATKAVMHAATKLEL